MAHVGHRVEFSTDFKGKRVAFGQVMDLVRIFLRDVTKEKSALHKELQWL